MTVSAYVNDLRRRVGYVPDSWTLPDTNVIFLDYQAMFGSGSTELLMHELLHLAFDDSEFGGIHEDILDYFNAPKGDLAGLTGEQRNLRAGELLDDWVKGGCK